MLIEHGASVGQISKTLEKEGVIKYRRLFKLLATLYNYRFPLKSGEYLFTAGVNPYQILLKISSGTSIVHRLYIPEGITSSQAMEIINQNQRLLGVASQQVPEGYLMPSTYFYSYGDRKAAIVKIMLNEMSSNLDKVMALISPDHPVQDRIGILTLASIIEKEAGNDTEKPLISSVFVNRLRKNMRLQADPTVIYAITKGQFKFSRSLTRADLRIDSPYNTYRVYGLPPTPICLPSFSSLLAAAQPEKSDYYYFVSNGQGSHNFAKNLAQHNKNVAYLKSMRRKK